MKDCQIELTRRLASSFAR